MAVLLVEELLHGARIAIAQQDMSLLAQPTSTSSSPIDMVGIMQSSRM
jgi:hypothetical protein